MITYDSSFPSHKTQNEAQNETQNVLKAKGKVTAAQIEVTTAEIEVKKKKQNRSLASYDP